MAEQAHDYRDAVRKWGHDLTYRPIGGDRLRATGWGFGLRPGDYMLLTNGDDDTRYRIGDDLRYVGGPGGPKDMWSATLLFAPRQGTPSEGDET